MITNLKFSKNQIIRHLSLKLKRLEVNERKSGLFLLLYKHRMKVVVEKRATCICTFQVQQNLMSDLLSYIFEAINNEERKWQKHFALQGLEREKRWKNSGKCTANPLECYSSSRKLVSPGKRFPGGWSKASGGRYQRNNKKSERKQ